VKRARGAYDARMPDLPSGTVTFAFTDIEDSTALLLKLGDLYGDTLAEHRRLVREAFSAEGVEIDTQGDAFFFAFPRARDAVAAAAAVQRAHAGFDWPHGAAVRVRIGLHTGEPHVGDEGYLGLDVVRAARICTAARGGQVLLSEATRALLGSALPDGVEVYPRGERQLKGIDEPERIFELEIEGAPVPEEEAAAAEQAPTPAQATPDDLGKRLSEAIEQHVAQKLESVVKRFEPAAAPVGDDEAVETLANRSASLEETISQRVAAALRAKGITNDPR
jgi:class 3 adenylate cyclase